MMSDVMVEVDVAFMDRVRSRVRSVPSQPFEVLLTRLERTQDVEPLEDLFQSQRHAEFLRLYKLADIPPDLPFETAMVSKLPIWQGNFVALHLATNGEVRSSVCLEIAELFAAALADETGMISSRSILVDCVAGSVSFKAALEVGKIAGPVLGTIAAAMIAAGAISGQRNPDTICFVKRSAELLREEDIASITVYSNGGEAFTCDKAIIIESAEKLPEPIRENRGASSVQKKATYERSDGSIEVEGFFDSNDSSKFIITAPRDAVYRLDTILTELPPERAGAPETDKPYRITGHWNGTMRRGRFLVLDGTNRLDDRDGTYEKLVEEYQERRSVPTTINFPLEQKDANDNGSK